MSRVYIFIDRKGGKGCDSLKISSVLDLQDLPTGTYKMFSIHWVDTTEFTELDRDPSYRKVVL